MSNLSLEDKQAEIAALEEKLRKLKEDVAQSGDKENKTGLQGRRAKASTGPRMDDSTTNLIGGESFLKREANPSWIKVRADIYDDVKKRRDEELSKKVPVDIEVTLPDGKVLSEDKVR